MKPIIEDRSVSFESADEEKQLLREKKKKTYATASTKSNRYDVNNKPFFPRLIERNLPFKQSQNLVSVQNRERDRVPLFPRSLNYILSHNWFHIALRWPTILSIMGLVFMWFLWVYIFAHIYVYLDARKPYLECGLGKAGKPIALTAAIAFSLETCTTVGYGLPNDSNNFFEPECRSFQIAIALQMVWSMLFNAFLTAFLWCRFARCEARGAQVLFSDKAIIEQRDGKWLFHIRMYDVDSRLPVVEAHVRFYCASWIDYDNQVKRSEQPHLLESMRIMHPDDELGSVIFTSVPINATHHIDFYSPLTPPHLRKNLNYLTGHGLILREVDQISGSIPGCVCPVCGETYETFDTLERHFKFNRILEEADDKVPLEGTHKDPNMLMQLPKLTKKLEITKQDLIDNLRDKEIICVVEGIEPVVSGTFQAIHSYKLEDIKFDSCFAPCVFDYNGKIVVDLDEFHQILPRRKSRTALEYDSLSVSSSESGRRSIFSNRNKCY
mmetsp:Transcript_457/g.501  ORF Transcript_457/g.501 Transcript_457/m.501 type:complete len:496 (+) Transcript_457:201-1688(+)